jgi:rSAM/selenodomain-associated transferase 2
LLLSIIIPVIDEAKRLHELASELAPAIARGCEVIVVDGGSADDSVSVAQTFAHVVITAPKGRASQMNAGAAAARGDILLFLHADSALPRDGDIEVGRAIKPPGAHGPVWGRFDIAIQGTSPWFPVIAWFMNCRSRCSGIATGDQGIFMRRSAFDAVGRYPEIPLMEDVAISQSLKAISPPACVAARMHTSGRRWEQRGVFRTIGLMWWLRFDYWRGISPSILHARYYGTKA